MRVVLTCLMLFAMSGIAVADSISWDKGFPKVEKKVTTLKDGTVIFSFDGLFQGRAEVSKNHKASFLFKEPGAKDWNEGGVTPPPGGSGIWRGGLDKIGKWEVKPVIKDKDGKIIKEAETRTVDIPSAKLSLRHTTAKDKANGGQ